MSEDNDKLELEVHHHETSNATYHHKHPNSFVYMDEILVHDHKLTPPVPKPE